jgi:hypothetical protein
MLISETKDSRKRQKPRREINGRFNSTGSGDENK